MSQNASNMILRRRFPRRRFFRRVGILYQGKYFLGKGSEIGEGGVLVSSPVELDSGRWAVVTFMVPGGQVIICRAVIRYKQTAEDTKQVTFGMQFTNINFTQRRFIRDYIAAKSRSEAEMDGVIPS